MNFAAPAMAALGPAVSGNYGPSTATSSASACAPSGASPTDAVQLLLDDHRCIRALFVDYALAAAGPASAADRQGLLARIGERLRVHTRIEQELFYPALAEARVDPALLAQLKGSHADWLEQLRALVGADPQEAGFDGRVSALAEAVNAHLHQEETEVFPVVPALGLAAIGPELALRRDALLAGPDVD